MMINQAGKKRRSCIKHHLYRFIFFELHAKIADQLKAISTNPYNSMQWFVCVCMSLQKNIRFNVNPYRITWGIECRYHGGKLHLYTHDVIVAVELITSKWSDSIFSTNPTIEPPKSKMQNQIPNEITATIKSGWFSISIVVFFSLLAHSFCLYESGCVTNA